MRTDSYKPSRILRLVSLAACFALCLAFVPRLLCGRAADRFYDGDLEAQDGLARAVVRGLDASPDLEIYATPSLRFNGQSAVAIYQMSIMGLGQIALEHPERRARYLPAMLRAADRLTNPRTLRHATRAYGHHGLVRMQPGEGHAYLGYVNLALGMLRRVAPDNPHAALHDRLTAKLIDRIARSPTGLIETYPGETWPPDVAAVVGSIGLHARATGQDHSALIEGWAPRFAACALDGSGYLVQRVKTGTCEPLDAPRGSGTAIASYFLSFAHADLSRRLHDALVRSGWRSLAGFGGIREYAPGHSGRGDVNAGPIVAGISAGATGFALGAARTHADRELFVELFRTAHLLGAPGDGGFVMGGRLGNALLLAMLTARPP
ncbi:MAG: hypothetical protein JXR96_25055 [Deltaproteobacteria bacterium]|nr:hypothetical protein [Deltaproteobacteria bacterium]